MDSVIAVLMIGLRPHNCQNRRWDPFMTIRTVIIISLLLYSPRVYADFSDIMHSTAGSEVRESSSAVGHTESDYENTSYIGEPERSSSTESPDFYGLNESNSRSWAQLSKDGIAGISYFQKNDYGSDAGILVYETINPDGTGNIDTVTTGNRLEKSVLLIDSLSSPHIFVARSNDSDQAIDNYSKDGTGQWQCETIINFNNEGGKFIYELSGDTGPDGSFYLLILKTRSDIDSADFNWAWLDSHLYLLTNVSGSWQKELIRNFDMGYNSAFYIKSSSRQDIKIDIDGYVHVTFNEQIDEIPDPSRLWYATNRTGQWVFEIAFNHAPGTRDDAGWFPSLCLNRDGIPYIACTYVKRYSGWSAMSSRLYLINRVSQNNWNTELVADQDDLYYGNDGRKYTGALTHLVFDDSNRPHIVFSDIASSHWEYNRLNVGNIRYGVFHAGSWHFNTIYRSPLPVAYLNAVEIHGLCLLYSDHADSVRVIGQELNVAGEFDYSSRLLKFAWERADLVPTRLQDFGAMVNQRGVVVSWRLSEVGAVEFDILRASDVDGTFRRLPSPDISRDDLSYVFVDNSCQPGHKYRYRIVALENDEQWTLFETDALLIPFQTPVLYQNHPNPFNPVTTISFVLPERLHANLSIFDLNGALVRTLFDGILSKGLKEVTWNGTGAHGNKVSSGVYFYRLRVGGKILTRKMVILK